MYPDDLDFDSLENESKMRPVTDSMGREIFWEDLGRPDGE